MRLPCTTLFFLLVSISYAGPKAIGTAILTNTPAVEPGGFREVEGIGSLREIGSALTASVRVINDAVTPILLARISTAGSPAVRLYIRGLALNAGANLYFYGTDENGIAGNVYGPYTRSGPLKSGDFWTEAIAGSEIVIELQTSSGIPADLPFEVVGLAPADLSEVGEPTPAPPSEGEVRTSLFRGRALTHSIENGLAVFEGDIILGVAAELPAATGHVKGRRDAVAITGQQYRWPAGYIPYVIDPAIPTPTRITNAIAHWNNTMAGHVQLAPRSSESAYVYFSRAASSATCSSPVGRTGYQQVINIGDSCATGNVIHEIGHSVGLWHEQGREDRNTFVKINWENIQSGKEYNFNQNITNGDDVGSYNYGSIMHYPATGFSSNGLPTIETIPAGIPIGQRSGLNAGDIAALKVMYPASSIPAPTIPSTVAVTLSSNPSGMPLSVDGVVVAAPATMNWAPGSVHTIAALNPPVVNGTRNAFSKWTDGGAATHQITAPTTATTLRADYVTSHSLITTASPVGSVAKTPASADTFYVAGTNVGLNAIAPSGYCFTSWTGLIAGAASQTSLAMTRPYSLQANFQTGTVSVAPSSLTVSRQGDVLRLDVSATSGCLWRAESSAAWVTITSAASGSGPGVVTVSVEAKKGGKQQRTAVITVAGQSVTISQQ